MRKIIILILTFLVLVALKKLYDKYFNKLFHKLYDKLMK